MNYAQLNEDGSYLRELPSGNVEFGPRHFQPARTLTEAEKAAFRIVPLTKTEPPPFDPITQTVQRDGGEFVGGAWQYKWAVIELEAAAVADNLAQAREKACTAIKAHRDSLSDNGGYLVAGKWFHSDIRSKIQQLGLTIMGQGVPPVQWKTMDKTKVQMTPVLAGQIFQAAAAQDIAIFARAEALIDLVKESNDPASIDITTGWPETFAG